MLSLAMRSYIVGKTLVIFMKVIEKSYIQTLVLTYEFIF